MDDQIGEDKDNNYLIPQSRIPNGGIKQRHLSASAAIAEGDIYYGDGRNNFQRIAVGANGQYLGVSGGIPTWKTLIVPGYTTAERDALTEVAAGTVILNTSTSKLNFYTGAAWEAVTSA